MKFIKKAPYIQGGCEAHVRNLTQISLNSATSGKIATTLSQTPFVATLILLFDPKMVLSNASKFYWDRQHEGEDATSSAIAMPNKQYLIRERPLCVELRPFYCRKRILASRSYLLGYNFQGISLGIPKVAS